MYHDLTTIELIRGATTYLASYKISVIAHRLCEKLEGFIEDLG